MGIKIPLFNKGSEFDANTVIEATEAGKHANTEQLISSLKQVSIMDKLEEAPRSIHDLAKNTQMNVFDVRNQVTKMRKNHWVRIVEE